MSVVSEVIRIEDNNTLSFGNYSVKEKQKVSNFNFVNNIYKVKTHDQVTRIEENGELLLETVPGSTVHNFYKDDKAIMFSIEGYENTSIIMELERDAAYRITINGTNIGSTKSNSYGKINFSLDLKSSKQNVNIEKL